MRQPTPNLVRRECITLADLKIFVFVAIPLENFSKLATKLNGCCKIGRRLAMSNLEQNSFSPADEATHDAELTITSLSAELWDYMATGMQATAKEAKSLPRTSMAESPRPGNGLSGVGSEFLDVPRLLYDFPTIDEWRDRNKRIIQDSVNRSAPRSEQPGAEPEIDRAGGKQDSKSFLGRVLESSEVGKYSTKVGGGIKALGKEITAESLVHPLNIETKENGAL